MEKTYCEKTGKNSYGIHITEQEFGLISDLLNSTNHPMLKKIRDKVNNLIRSENVFPLFIKDKTVICESCSGHGKILNPHEIMFESTIETCETCLGSGRIKLTTIQRWEPYDSLTSKHMLPLHYQKPLKFIEK